MIFRAAKILLRFALLLCFLQAEANASSAAESSAVAGSLTEAEVKTMLQDYIDTDKLGVGIAIGIVDTNGPRVIGHGKLDNGTDCEVNGDTVFEIGSVTKLFTALLLQDMVERGEMRLDDPVQKFLPDSAKLPTFQGRAITLLHLATHTSGLPRDGDGGLFPFLSRCTLHRAPGTLMEYSNLGMALLGYVIALKAGKDYETLVEERICQPLGMESTRVALLPPLKSRFASGHIIPGHRVHSFTGVSEFPGAGSLHSTANDLLKFVAAYAGITPSPLSGVMQKAEALHKLESGEERRLAWGLENGSVFEHGGLTIGFQSELAFDAKKHRGVVVLSNCRPYSDLVPAIWQPLLDGRSPRPTNTVSIKPNLLDCYVGLYRCRSWAGVFSVRREDGRLILESTAPQIRYSSFEVFPCSAKVFRNQFWGVQAEFFPTSRDRCELLLSSLGPYSGIPKPTRLTRVSTVVPSTPNPVHLDSEAYENNVGQYRKTFLFGLIRLGPTLTISHRNDEDGDHLVAFVPGYGTDEIFPATENTFILEPGSSNYLELTFLRSRKGRTKSVRILWNNQKYSGTRISEKPSKQ
jgi:serine-type D-Ala-D-Ala carboxypeptidase/endopeptidase